MPAFLFFYFLLLNVMSLWILESICEVMQWKEGISFFAVFLSFVLYT